MRGSRLLVFTAASVIALSPAWALQVTDTMRSWIGASTKERSALVDRILGQGPDKARSAGILACVNEASKISGHADLEIGEVVKGCESPGMSGQPV